LEKLIVTRVKGFDPHHMVAATMVLEGSKDEVEYQYRVALETAKSSAASPAVPATASGATC
jgi:hypothetical protein